MLYKVSPVYVSSMHLSLNNNTHKQHRPQRLCFDSYNVPGILTAHRTGLTFWFFYIKIKEQNIFHNLVTETIKPKSMSTSATHDQRIASMTFASVYPMYIAKVEKKGRTKEELHQVIEWLTGFSNKKLQDLIKEKVTFEAFFRQAKLNPNAHLITGVICGYRVEEITNPLTQQVRYLDKLVDELAKGRKMEKILRS